VTLDIQIIRGNNQPTPSRLAYADPARALDGTAKAAQKFTNLFLREFDATRDRGTNFPIAMKTGKLNTDAAIQLEFTSSTFRLIRQLGDQSTLPKSEQIVSADLVTHALFEDSLSLTVRLTTQDGETDFIIPIERL
jgi:hypothetical protein